MDPKTQKITDANPFLFELLQFKCDEVVGKELYEIGVFKDIEASKEAFTKLTNNLYVRYEDLPLQRKDGTAIDVEFVSNVYSVLGEPTIQCNIRDITDRKSAEKKAIEVLERLNHFMSGREVKMAELKMEIESLKEKLETKTL
jgi:PAS domain S-box-containing protein